VEDLAPFSHSLSEQVAQLQRRDIDDRLKANGEVAQHAADQISTIAAVVARLDERSLHAADRMTSMETTLTDLKKEVGAVKDLTNRYKGGIAVILSASAVLVGMIAFWDKLIAKLHG
jgi:phage-related protein